MIPSRLNHLFCVIFTTVYQSWQWGIFSQTFPILYSSHSSYIFSIKLLPIQISSFICFHAYWIVSSFLCTYINRHRWCMTGIGQLSGRWTNCGPGLSFESPFHVTRGKNNPSLNSHVGVEGCEEDCAWKRFRQKEKGQQYFVLVLDFVIASN